jgi:DNA-binding transcriptional LysR family regulator
MRTLSLVAERSSFAEAARELRISPTKASRLIAELEADLGASLLRRTTRSVGLTEAGAHYLERCRPAMVELDEADRAIRGEAGEARGLLVISAPVLFGRMLVRPVVGELLRRHARLEVKLLLLDRVARLVDEGIDVAVRIGELSDSALAAVRVREVRRILVASPAYLAARGVPREPAQLHDHDLISFDRFAPNGVSGALAGRATPRCVCAPD